MVMRVDACGGWFAGLSEITLWGSVDTQERTSHTVRRVCNPLSAMSDPEGSLSASTVPPPARAPSSADSPATSSSKATSTVASAASASILGAQTPLSGSSGSPPAPS
ncbi:hypothetical protein PF005_g24609 [Phytophthora fragariae]|uniref:Uncharacterized protein n=1 Tax=Phytophthora fragariae TaxID=53985 RepID=A0A6A3W1D1_9STRA|nr:hypothetical protein PF005_g24609 [Phytophthora fragariae]KAE9274952.1 hypothetical protein PF001_g26816 [Phytophthora fragariae]